MKSTYEHLISTSWEHTFRPPFLYGICSTLLHSGNEDIKDVISAYKQLDTKFGNLVSMYMNVVKKNSILESENKLLKNQLLEKENKE
jgi:hypothetical protein